MVKILGLNGFLALVLCLLTFGFYSKYGNTSNCEIRVLTSNSFFSGIGDDLITNYKRQNKCDLKFDVVNGANLISNLFNKQPNRYDMLIGLDVFQIDKIPNKTVMLPAGNSKAEGLIYKDNFIVYDEAPLTFFLRGSKDSEFANLTDFLNHLKKNKLSVAVPLKTTSVLGALFEDWMLIDIQGENKQMSPAAVVAILNERLNFNSIKFVKSWSEGFGLFERKIVDGFLSFETSEIYFAETPNVKKISLQKGHPNLKEYLTFSKYSKLPNKEKIKLLDFILSESTQKLLLEKNYMWPINLKEHNFSEYRNLKIINLNRDR